MFFTNCPKEAFWGLEAASADFCTVPVPVSSVFGSFSFCPEVMIGGKLQRDKVSVS